MESNYFQLPLLLSKNIKLYWVQPGIGTELWDMPYGIWIGILRIVEAVDRRDHNYGMAPIWPHGRLPLSFFSPMSCTANVSFWPVNIFALFFFIFFFAHFFHSFRFLCDCSENSANFFSSSRRGGEGEGPWIYGLWHKVGSNRDRNIYIPV